MAHWLNLGEMVAVHAAKTPQAPCLMDHQRTFTFADSNARSNQLANALLNLGLTPGDRVAALLENCIEYVEIYLAAAKAGLVVVPVSFRLVEAEVAYVVGHSGARIVIVGDEFVSLVETLRSSVGNVPEDHFVVVGEAQPGYRAYEDLLGEGGLHEPDVKVRASDPWIQLYTSGTTGRPKGVVRSHESYVAFYLINAVDFGFSARDRVLNIMPLFHVNTTFFTFAFTYLGGSAYIQPARGFDPEGLLATVSESRATFISLIPTHYALMLALSEEARNRYDISSVDKLLCSSAPARVEHKKAVMAWFKGVQLFEGYGSTEAGIVTTLFPDEQLTKPGSIGRESLGTSRIKLLDDHKMPVTQGEIGELYSRGPMLFDGYFEDPERTTEAHADEWFSAGDMAYQDSDGYYFLVDRKHNMIITGGEHVYPSEIENVLAGHQQVFDSAIIGVSDPKWGEKVVAVVIAKQESLNEQEVIDYCRQHLASFKVPKVVHFISSEEMPRTATGKILHRVLRNTFSR